MKSNFSPGLLPTDVNESNCSPSISSLPAKVLMLHVGHGQSGQFFQCKTRFFEERLRNTILEASRVENASSFIDTVQFHYPSGLFPANPDQSRDDDDGCSAWAWGYGDHQRDEVQGLQKSVDFLFEILSEEGPFIGVVGFSTGAALAAIITSLLEKRESICGFRFQTDHLPFKFAVCCSGFKLGNPMYEKIYHPAIRTPTLHAIARMDTMIEPEESLELAHNCSNVTLYSFFGTHYVPRTARFLDVLADLMQKAFHAGQKSEMKRPEATFHRLRHAFELEAHIR